MIGAMDSSVDVLAQILNNNDLSQRMLRHRRHHGRDMSTALLDKLHNGKRHPGPPQSRAGVSV